MSDSVPEEKSAETGRSEEIRKQIKEIHEDEMRNLRAAGEAARLKEQK
jgi:hypothetical protein